MKKIILLLLLLVTQIVSVQASSVIPPSLVDWIPWVTKDDPKIECPLVVNHQKQCTWGSVLKLDLTASGGVFEQEWHVFAPSFVSLPGDSINPPLNVSVNGAAAPQVMQGKLSSVFLEKGNYLVRGEFSWKQIPESLYIAPQIGLLTLNIDGHVVLDAKREDDGYLWLKSEAVQTTADDSLDIEVFRKLEDGIPVQLITNIELKVSGQNREINLGAFLPSDFIPLSLSSPIPAKIEPDGSLTLQLRPGEFSVFVTARHPGNVALIEVPKIESPWPVSEVWVWSHNALLRQVDIGGVSTIDPTQTSLPKIWHAYAAYLVQAGQQLTLSEKSRGLVAKKADRLSLNRQMWLDFNGKGLTIKDSLSGSLNNKYRLETQPAYQLGRVTINGQDQLITTIDKKNIGVEVRDKNISAVAESRLVGSFINIPASGWNHDLQSVSVRLNLPPGWRLFAAPGVDMAPFSWTAHWTLMDFFLILVVTVGVFKLFGAKEAFIALLAMVLSYHEKNSLDYAWPVLLVFAALNRYTKPISSWAKILRVMRLLTLILIVCGLIPFAVHQLRTGMHPILEKSYQSLNNPESGASDDNNFSSNFMLGGAKSAPPPPSPELLVDSVANQADEEPQVYAVEQRENSPNKKRSAYPLSKVYQNLNKADPNAKVQTGLGMANWGWQLITLDWAGPVSPDHKMSLLLLSPWMNLILAFLRVFLVFGFLALLAEWPLFQKLALLLNRNKLLLIGSLLLLPVYEARADFPEQALLDSLKVELAKDPLCYPDCVSIEKGLLSLDQDLLVLSLKVNAIGTTSVSLPQSADWSPQAVLLDNQAATIFRDNIKTDWVVLNEGVHELILRGTVRGLSSISLNFPMVPLKMSTNLSGWTQEGLSNEKLNGALELSKQGGVVAADEIITQDLSPFVKVEREFYFGLDWEVVTRVVRVGSAGTSLTLDYPLLPGEFVSGDEPKVVDGKAHLVFGPQDNEVLWNSRLNLQDTIELVATKTNLWVESWKIMSSPQWHVEADGIPAIGSEGVPGELYAFSPWPEETVTLKLTKPVAVEGQTMAIDNVFLKLNPGIRSTDAELKMTVRSSLAVSHEIIIPEDSEIRQVLVDGKEVPLSFAKGHIRLDIKPGAQEVSLQWRSPQGVSLLTKSPQVDLGVPGVNVIHTVEFPANRWILGLCGPGFGPVMLFWNYLVILIIAGFILSRLPGSFLKMSDWFLLGLGLTQVTAPAAVIIALWFMSVSYRQATPDFGGPFKFNIRQLGLVLLTLVTLGIFIDAIKTGLLGNPEMQIMGNGSYGTYLTWFADRSEASLPQVKILSVSLWFYRLLMLSWALWLANSFVTWARLAWLAFTNGGAWKKMTTIIKKPD